MADTPSPTVTLPRDLLPAARAEAERALSMYGEPSRASILVSRVWSAILLAADQAEAAAT